MEKIRIQITKENLFSMLLICVGLFYFFSGVKAYREIKNAVLITDIEFDKCSDVQYVCGDIDCYVVKEIETLGAESYSGVSTTWLTSLGAEYNFYTIPIVDNKYIRVMIQDKTLIESLGKFTKGQGKGIYFEGEIIEASIPLEYTWYNDIVEFQGKVLGEVVQPQYVIREVSFSEKIKKMYIGIVFLIAAIGNYKLLCGTGSFIIREKIDVKKTILQPTVRYNRKNELEAEKRKLEILQQRLKELKKGCLYKAFLIICGISIITHFYLWEVKVVGIFIVLAGIRGVWKYFINSHYSIAKYIARMFGIDTLWEQIETCEYRIQILSNSIANEE